MDPMPRPPAGSLEAAPTAHLAPQGGRSESLLLLLVSKRKQDRESPPASLAAPGSSAAAHDPASTTDPRRSTRGSGRASLRGRSVFTVHRLLYTGSLTGLMFPAKNFEGFCRQKSYSERDKEGWGSPSLLKRE
ncbi:Hypothetical predicted protein [Marmota monax]|uniref:Uncharacterized protein n=1 Tax=Marmota monax TaxID=9995 RepID=A0A5E4BJD9_MARMO|nr:hypothetical protein GHT09_015509 [Marmota monax]VTJ69049.1 Hypothetical predicted protein [Marmota monax]